MIAAFLLSLGQLGDRRILLVLAKSLAVTLVLLATIGTGLWFGAAALARWAGFSDANSGIAGLLAVIAGLALGWLIFRALAIAVIGIFADDVVAAVEAKHYPQALARARPVPFARGLAMGAGSAARAILWNVAAIPLYVLLLATGIGTPIGFFAVNAALLGRDLGDMVAARHRAPAELLAFRNATRIPRLLLGASGTALLLIPFVNLLAPVLGAAMATHVFHRRLSQ
ncbi:MAG: EI24 domain-containing protein [Pseudomonadota bacterium]